MALGILESVRTARAQLLIDALDAGAAGGTIKLYTASRPATGAAITDQTLLATLTLSATSGVAAAGVLTFNAITADSSADATNTIAWGRAADSDGNFVLDLSCTATSGGGDIEFNTLSTIIGNTVSVNTGGTFTEGNA